jgi:hypothetical protein
VVGLDGRNVTLPWCTWYKIPRRAPPKTHAPMATTVSRGSLWSVEVGDHAASIYKDAGTGVRLFRWLFCQGEVAGSNPVVRSTVVRSRESSGQKLGPRTAGRKSVRCDSPASPLSLSAHSSTSPLGCLPYVHGRGCCAAQLRGCRASSKAAGLPGDDPVSPSPGRSPASQG